MKTTSITPAQQKVLDNLKAGMELKMEHTKYLDGEDFYCFGGFAGQRRGVPVRTILAMAEKGLIKEASRRESRYSSITSIIVYQIAE